MQQHDNLLPLRKNCVGLAQYVSGNEQTKFLATLAPGQEESQLEKFDCRCTLDVENIQPSSFAPHRVVAGGDGANTPGSARCCTSDAGSSVRGEELAVFFLLTYTLPFFFEQRKTATCTDSSSGVMVSAGRAVEGTLLNYVVHDGVNARNTPVRRSLMAACL